MDSIIANVNTGQDINVYWQDEVELQLDLNLMYIKSGQKEIQDYVDNVSKPEINDYVETEAKPLVSRIVTEIAEPTVSEYIETTVKPEIDDYVEDKKPELQAFVTQAQGFANDAQEAADTATANLNSYVDGTVKPSLQTYVDQAQEEANSAATSMEQAALSATSASNYASNASADADNSAESAGLAANSATAAATSKTNAKTSETNAKIWAEGTDAQVQALGGEKSAKGWAEASTAVNYTNITNCITKIPQDIKLELNNGTLTLKAGSKIYVPNGKNADGSLKFDEVVIESDISLTQSWGSSQTFLLFYDTNGSRLRIYDTGRCYSGTTSVSDGAYYNTNDNKLYVYDGGSLNFTASLPIAIITGQSPTISSIDQVFNGFGYIGSTVFALPGVKGLIPNGRNTDGSLKNIEFTVSSVLTNTQTNTAGKTWGLYFNPDGSHAGFSLGVYKKSIRTLSDRPTTWKGGYCIYVEDENKNYINQNTVPSTVIMVADIVIGSSSITSFAPKTAFHALDYNDKSTISGLGMPSNRYIDLTLGASGATYTAPANGWFDLNFSSSAQNGFIAMYARMSASATANSGRYGVSACIPVVKGENMSLFYGNGSASLFRFYYAEGEN